MPPTVNPRHSLLTHPLSFGSNNDRGTLPEAAVDPHPALTLALYDLWTSLRPLIRFNAHNQPVIAFAGPIENAHQVLTLIGPSFVSSNFFCN